MVLAGDKCTFSDPQSPGLSHTHFYLVPKTKTTGDHLEKKYQNIRLSINPRLFKHHGTPVELGAIKSTYTIYRRVWQFGNLRVTH